MQYTRNAWKGHVNSLARMASACMLRGGLVSFMYNISQTKTSNLLLHFFRTSKRWLVFVLLLHAVARCFPVAE